MVLKKILYQIKKIKQINFILEKKKNCSVRWSMH